MKVSELEGALLDYWVAQHSPQCINMRFEWRGEHWVGIGEIDGKDEVIVAGAAPGFFAGLKARKLYGKELMAVYRPSSDWSQGGPIIEQEQMAVVNRWEDWRAGYQFDVSIEYGDPVMELKHEQVGSTPLIAAMRAFVSSKLGAEVPDIVLKSGENP